MRILIYCRFEIMRVGYMGEPWQSFGTGWINDSVATMGVPTHFGLDEPYVVDETLVGIRSRVHLISGPRFEEG